MSMSEHADQYATTAAPAHRDRPTPAHQMGAAGAALVWATEEEHNAGLLAEMANDTAGSAAEADQMARSARFSAIEAERAAAHALEHARQAIRSGCREGVGGMAGDRVETAKASAVEAATVAARAALAAADAEALAEYWGFFNRINAEDADPADALAAHERADLD